MHPLHVLYDLRKKLGREVDSEKWNKARKTARKLIEQIEIVRDNIKDEEGRRLAFRSLYNLGWNWYQRAPEKTKQAINKFNKRQKEVETGN